MNFAINPLKEQEIFSADDLDFARLILKTFAGKHPEPWVASYDSAGEVRIEVVLHHVGDLPAAVSCGLLRVAAPRVVSARLRCKGYVSDAPIILRGADPGSAYALQDLAHLAEVAIACQWLFSPVPSMGGQT